MGEGTIVSITISGRKGEKKNPVPEAYLLAGRGIMNDAHAEGGLRQVSLLMDESIERFRLEENIRVSYGDFAENIVTRGVDLGGLKAGDRIRVSSASRDDPRTPAGASSAGPLLEVTMIGKSCTAPCRIYYQVGSCIMPKEGVFCRVLESGLVGIGDAVSFESV